MRLGIDLGGTKTEAAVISDDGVIIWRHRIPTDKSSYLAILDTIELITSLARKETGYDGPVGMAIPGALSTRTGKVRGANTTILKGQDLRADCEARTGRSFRLDNDANCFALSEAIDGAATGYGTVFGAILGTGCGGGIVVNGRPLPGANALAGEWGHTPLPWPLLGEYEGHDCWCGQEGCVETFISGTAVSEDYANRSGVFMPVEEIASSTGTDLVAESVLQVLEDRLGRALAQIIMILDPDAIVLGGGLSNLDRLYTNVPRKWPAFVLGREVNTPLLKPLHGDSSGVRGAAWLWSDEE